jgi:hypothetical protein
MRAAVAVTLALLAWTPAGAGELIFANGSKLQGELSNESLMVSTGSGLVEIVPDEVTLLTREEVRLRDGRVIRGTLVGDQIKARTSLGEIAVKVDELQTYRASAPSTDAATGAAAPASQPSVSAAPAAATPAATPSTGPAAATPGQTGIVNGLPTVAAYQQDASATNGRSTNGAPPVTVQSAVLTKESPTTSASRTYEVVGESVMYRDALFSSSKIGRVAAGQQVRYVDSIDRRLRILNLLVFDGGHWVKIRLSDGTEGWVPADTVREVR